MTMAWLNLFVGTPNFGFAPNDLKKTALPLKHNCFRRQIMNCILCCIFFSAWISARIEVKSLSSKYRDTTKKFHSFFSKLKKTRGKKNCQNKMDNNQRRSRIMSGSSDVSMYHNNNNHISDEAALKVEQSAESPVIMDETGIRNYFLRWKGFEGNLLRWNLGLR